MSKYHVTVQHDPDTEDPSNNGDDGRWKIYSFCKRHVNFKDPEEFLIDQDTETVKAEIQAKLESGLAFFLSYYEHGLCMWSLAGTGPQCQWDSVSKAGIAIWEEPEENNGAKTYDDRAKDCKVELEEYTDWCNGNCYYYRITTKKGKEIGSSGSIIGDYIADAIREELPEDATKENTEIDDQIGCLAYVNLFDRKSALTPA